jgi:hypothetical protein
MILALQYLSDDMVFLLDFCLLFVQHPEQTLIQLFQLLVIATILDLVLKQLAIWKLHGIGWLGIGHCSLAAWWHSKSSKLL